MAAARRLKPLFDRVLVEKVVAPTKSAGGVLLPETAAKKLNEGKVVAVGPGRLNPHTNQTIPTAVKEGDTVLLPEYGGTPLKLEDNKDVEYAIYREEELLGVLTQ